MKVTFPTLPKPTETAVDLVSGSAYIHFSDRHVIAPALEHRDGQHAALLQGLADHLAERGMSEACAQAGVPEMALRYIQMLEQRLERARAAVKAGL